MNPIISGGRSSTPHTTTITANNSFIAALPKEILTLIFSRLKDSDLVHFAGTSKPFYYFRSYVWELRLRDYFPDSYANLKSLAEIPSLYKRLRIIDNNIKKGHFSIDAVSGHKENITSLALSGNLLISGSRDGTIKIWDIKNRQEQHTLEGHKDAVTNILVYDGMVISGSEDRTIKVWNLTEGKLLKTFEGYQGRSLAVYGDHLIAGQLYGALRIWDLKSGQRLPALKGKQHQIQCITVCGDQLFSGSSERTIAIWDLKTGKELTILGPHKQITSVMVYKDKLISGAYDGSIEVRNLKSGQIQTVNAPTVSVPPPCPVDRLVAYDGKLFFPSDGIINLLDLETEESQTFTRSETNTSIHENILYCNGQLIYCNGQLIFGTDKKVSILDFTDPSLLQPIKTLPPFLADLGIVTEEACLQKLNCSSDFLSKIGIYSSTDVQALGVISPVISPDFRSLEVVPEEADNNYIKLEAAANKKTKMIFSFLETLLEAVEEKSDEAAHRGTDNIWIPFQNKLKGIKADHDEVCKIRRTRLEKFRPESYKTIVAQMNGLIDEFRELDRKQQMNNQIVALSAYVGQPLIRQAWERLHKQGIHNLAALLEKKDIVDIFDLFHTRI